MYGEPCPDENTLRRYFFGELTEPVLAVVENHVSNCQQCADWLDGLESGSDFVELLRTSPNSRWPELHEPAYEAAVQQIFRHEFHEEATSFSNLDTDSQQLDTMSVENAAVVSEPSGKGETNAKPNAIIRSIGQYDLLEAIGRGGMGIVYRANHRRLNRLVAVKVLGESIVQDEVAVARFEKEMLAIGRLNHPNIVQAIDADEIAGVHVLVMEYVSGRTLSEVIRSDSPLSIERALAIIRQAAEGLRHIHAAGMVHRDIKPGNLMLSDNGTVKILDLGLALLTERADFVLDGVTAPGQMMGTIDYMAPEQADDTHSVDFRADIYSLGATLYALLAGQPPFAGQGNGGLLKKLNILATEMPTPLVQLRPDIPNNIDRLLNKALAKNPQERLATLAEFSAYLDESDPDKQLHQRHKWKDIGAVVILLGTIIFTVLIVAGIKLLNNWNSSPVNQSPDSQVVTTNAVMTLEKTEKSLTTPVEDPILSAKNSTETTKTIDWNQLPTTALITAIATVTDPTECAELTIHLAQREDGPLLLINKLNQEANATQLAMIWQTFGMMPSATIPPEIRDSVAKIAVQQFSDHPSADVHSAILWMVNNWVQSNPDEQNAKLAKQIAEQRELLQIRSPESESNWIETLHSDTLTIIPAGAHYIVGSPPDESERLSDNSEHSEQQRLVTIPHSFAVCTTEVTKRQLSEAWLYHGQKIRQSDSSQPITGLNWHEAAWYCNYRSEVEGIPKKEWCYQQVSTEPAPVGRFDVKKNYIQRAGYRLLNEDEWEFCCRGGTTTDRYFGTNENLADDYIVLQESGYVDPAPVATKRPNRLGLFDMLGNAAEWVNDPAQVTTGRKTRRVRGGSFRTGLSRIRAALRLRIEESFPHPTVGFRIAKTIPVVNEPRTDNVVVEVHRTWRPDPNHGSDFTELSDDWIPVEKTVCLGTGNRAIIPRRWFRIRNKTQETVNVGAVSMFGSAMCPVPPAKILAPGETTQFLLGRHGISNGVHYGQCNISLTTARKTERLSLRLISAIHDPYVFVFEAGDPNSTAESSFSFGTVHQYSDVFHNFTVWNGGDRPVDLIDVQVPVGFHTKQDWPRQILPHSFAWIHVKVETAQVGKHSGVIKITTSDPRTPVTSFNMTAYVTDKKPVSAFGVFRNGQWIFDKNRDGIEDLTINFGKRGDIPLIADWNGDGTADLCVCRDSGDGTWTWLALQRSTNSDQATQTLKFGAVSNTPILLKQKNQPAVVGVVENEPNGILTWQFDVDRDGNPDDEILQFQTNTACIPIAADLLGKGDVLPGFVHLNITSDIPNRAWMFQDAKGPVYFGEPNDIPIIGDWDGNGRDNLGVARSVHGKGLVWYLDISGGRLSEQEHIFGRLGDTPVVLPLP